ncbi:MAG: hypothetical protein IJ775_05755 [Muribaculaceae bacterium]|nr:hypothetical protein [Muribaculaceae bacterium]
MGKWKEQLSMSRHERQGALVVLAVMMVVVGTIWAAKILQPSASPAEQSALLEWAAEADSTRLQAAARDSIRHNGATKRHHERKAKSRGKGSKRKPQHTPSRPSGLPSAIPNY